MKSATVAMAYLVLPLDSLGRRPGPIPPTTDWAPLETVVVTAQSRGSRFLARQERRFGNLDSRPIADMPKDQSWNSKHLATVVDGAHAVLHPASGPQADLRGGLVSSSPIAACCRCRMAKTRTGRCRLICGRALWRSAPASTFPPKS